VRWIGLLQCWKPLDVTQWSSTTTKIKVSFYSRIWRTRSRTSCWDDDLQVSTRIVPCVVLCLTRTKVWNGTLRYQRHFHRFKLHQTAVIQNLKAFSTQIN
jgi:hypothetical protein